MVYIRGVMLHPSHGEAGNCRELMQYTADVVHPKAKSAGAVQWAHSSLSRIPPESLRIPVPNPSPESHCKKYCALIRCGESRDFRR